MKPCKHDLSLPDSIGVDVSNGKKYCRKCMCARKSASREAMKLRQIYCRNCSAPLSIGRVWSFCNTKCEHTYRSANSQEESLEEAKRTLELLALHSQLDRAATSWEREEIRAKIAAVK